MAEDQDDDSILDEMELEEILKIVKSTRLEEFPRYNEILQSSIDEANNGGNIGSISQGKMMEDEGKQINELEINRLILLPDVNFSTREELLKSVREITLTQGYATTIKKSKTNSYVIIGCDRGGKYRGFKSSIDQMKRATSTRLINCPFQLWGKRKLDGSWKVELKNLEHNHEPSSDMSGHPSCRCFSEEEINEIRKMSNAGIPPQQILISLRQSNPNLQAISRTIYNAKAKLRRDSLKGRTVIQALFDELGKGGFLYDIQYDTTGCLTHLFFAHPYSIMLTKNYPNVFVMDCTYKTNRYKFPLLDIIGISSFNTSFYSCFAPMQNEKEADFIWVLERFSKLLGIGNYPSVIVTDRDLALMNAIEVVFPSTTQLLCVWHIEKNILSKCKKYFEKNEAWETFLLYWTALVKSPDESSYEDAWKFLEVEYQQLPLVLAYLKKTWLPLKEKFVHAWTNKHLHYGNHVTSKAEGAHSMLKKFIQVSTGDLREVKQKIELAIRHQYQEIKVKLESEKLHIKHKFCVPMFQKLLGHVSMYALGKLFREYEIAAIEGPLFECKCHFKSSMGLPCAHLMREKADKVLVLADIDCQWRIDIRSFHGVDQNIGNEDDQMKSLLQEFSEKYQLMSLSQ